MKSRWRSTSDLVPGPAEPLREETLHSERLYEGRILNLRRDRVRLPDGREAEREVVEHRGSVVMLALHADGHIPFVRQWRAPARRALLELPAGTLDPGEDPEAAAARELEEEVGLRPGSLETLLTFWVAPGWAEEYMHGFLARDCTPCERAPEDDEILLVERYTLGQSMQLVRDGEIDDVKTIVMLQAFALRALGPLGDKVIRSYRGD